MFLAICSAASMVLGFARELLSARLFGASRELDLFLLCFMPFDLLLPATRDVPVAMQGSLAIERPSQARNVLRQSFRLALVLGTLLAAVYLCAYLAILWLAPEWGLKPAWVAIVVVLALSIPICLTHIPFAALGILRLKIVTFHGLQQVYLNAAIVLCLVLAGATFGVVSLAVGVLVGTLALMAHEYARLRHETGACLAGPFDAVDVKKWSVMVAFVAAQAIGSKSAMLVERTVGLRLPEGTISHLNYALRVWGIPINLFVIASIVPYSSQLASMMAEGRNADTYRLFRRLILRLALAFAPFVFAFWFFADPIVAQLFESGKFRSQDTAQVSDLLSLLVLGSFGALVSTAAVYTLWAFGRSISVALVTWVSVAVYFAASWMLSGEFAATGLASGSVIYYNLQAILLLVLLRREFRERGVHARTMPSPTATDS